MGEIQVIKMGSSDLAALEARQDAAATYLASLVSKNSRYTMKAALNTVAEIFVGSKQYGISVGRRKDNITYQFVAWKDIRLSELQAIRAELLNTYSPATVNKLMAAVRGVLKQAYLLDQIPENEYRKFEFVENVRNETLPAGRYIEGDEITALIAACQRDKTVRGVRDLAILALLYNCGLRRAELAALNIEDVNSDSGAVVVVRGKGRKARTVYAANGALEALRQWLKVRGDNRGSEPRPLFTRIRSQEQLTEERITDSGAYDILKRRSDEAGVKSFSPHDLRRTVITNLLSEGVDMVTVQKTAGHASPITTARYDRRGNEAVAEAAKKIQFKID